jgi:hypothetical protein
MEKLSNLDTPLKQILYTGNHRPGILTDYIQFVWAKNA